MLFIILKKLRKLVCVYRLKKGYPLEDYSLAELRTEFEKLTGESVQDILMLAGKEDNIETVRILMSYTIEHANTVGTPSPGTVLDATATVSTSRDIQVVLPQDIKPRDFQVVALKVYLFLPGLSSLFGRWDLI